ncbi:Vat family streptogramin A O-acetyltransferase [Iodidimonas gelatinilytica]|uniref:Vat family streptogramin A O-acetyltransferase n=1 Tax=Iodidimonas gelatinilytica TaxID=1236966 RepID=A0A5A7MSS0_9PROT|nr:CatB-related O-acetyltransferase [Iodidimonas gelatinilytica]GEQ98283.1 Vat family streptogramin A O-acetyltransferase [Iodidimonas gelatinilytica]
MPDDKVRFPDPASPDPLPHAPRVQWLKPLISRANIHVGDYSYYDDPIAPERFETDNVLYHFDHVGDLLRIGRFCALATGTTFIMNGANHKTNGISTFPFPIFGADWERHMALLHDNPSRGDTVLGHDVWCGYQSLIMPGVTIGHGAVVASRSVVTADVPPFAIVAGNPARIVKMRFSPEESARLLALAWWDWPIEQISRFIPLIMEGSITALEDAAAQMEARTS